MGGSFSIWKISLQIWGWCNRFAKKYISPTACGLWWNNYFHHNRTGSQKNSPIFPLRPPQGRTTKTYFCVGSDGYIRAKWWRKRPPLHPRLHDPSPHQIPKPLIQTNLRKTQIPQNLPHDTLCKTWKTKGYIANQISLVNISHKIISVVNISQCRAWSSHKSPLDSRV